MFSLITVDDVKIRGDRSSLLTYRHSAPDASSGTAMNLLPRGLVEVVERAATEPVSAMWEDVSSWAETSETSGSVSCSLDPDATCTREANTYSNDLQIRMERVHQLNMFRPSSFESSRPGNTVVVPESRTQICDVKSHTRDRIGCCILPPRSSLSDVVAWSHTTWYNDEDILLFGGLTRDSTEVVGVAKTLRMPDESVEVMKPGAHKWSVKHLAPAELSDLLEAGGEEALEMNAARPTYEGDLPEDLLELIDHTTQGVQRLYESARSVDMANASGEKTSSMQRGGRGGFIAHVNDSSRGRRLSAASRVAHVPGKGTGFAGGIAVAHDRVLPHPTNRNDSNGLYHAAESDGTNTSRQWSWSHKGMLPANGANNELSGTSTINSTLSLDPQRRPPPPLPSAAFYQGSASSTVNTSNTALEGHNSSHPAQRWKDTFKSLLSSAVVPNATAISTSSPGGVTILHTGEYATEQECKTHAVHDSAEPRESVNTCSPLRSHSPSKAQIDAAVERLQRKLEEQEVSHKEAILQLRSEHIAELAEFRRDTLEARQRAIDDTSTQLATSFSVKQKLLQAEIEGERARADEMRQLAEERMKSIEVLKAELEASASRTRSLQGSVSAKESQVTELREVLASARRQNVELEEEIAKCMGNMAECKQHEKIVEEREREMLSLVNRLESQLREQERRFREELRRLEEEFQTTTKSYQELITEATEKLTALEKMDRKYRTLKDNHRKQTQQKDELESRVGQLQEERQHQIKQIENLQEEVESLRLLLARKEHEMREERAGHHMVVEDITKRLGEHETKASHEVDRLKKEVHHAEESTARLRHEMEGLAQQLQEEQLHSKELLVKMEQSSIRHQEELLSTRRAASSYQQQSESVLASLKRQLREKDAKLEALATTASEPIQRLRRQLEDERGKRANLEEQFSRYKQKARVAKESSLREIRREQERAASASRSQSRAGLASSLRSATHESKALTESIPSAVAPAPVATTARTAGCYQHANGSATPTEQRAPRAVVSLPHSSRERTMTSPSQSAATRTWWESVGSISNISCSSPFSSRDEGVEDIERGVAVVARNSDTAPAVGTHTMQSPQTDDMDNRMAHHEELLREFHESAAAVFRRITGNRDEFLARCTSVVRAASHHTGNKKLSTALGGAAGDELSD